MARLPAFSLSILTSTLIKLPSTAILWVCSAVIVITAANANKQSVRMSVLCKRCNVYGGFGSRHVIQHKRHREWSPLRVYSLSHRVTGPPCGYILSPIV
eukprot:9480901-Pyramimonas_sp.AAC.1